MASATNMTATPAHIMAASLQTGDPHVDISLKWNKRIPKHSPWDEENDPLPLDGSLSLPMPVEVSSKDSLAPFFAHLKNNNTHEPVEGAVTGVEPFYNTELIEFEKGVLYADGRVDLCKMVTGPRNIGDLMESLKPNTFAKHFLLGNNIIGPTGAVAIASFVKEFPERFETWYLAGNCIDTASFSTLVDAMVTSPVITNIWLKRNPLKAAAAKDVFRLITQTPSLRTLDLDQTELGDAGVAELFTLLTNHNQPLPLRHLYLNACGISGSACAAVSTYLSTPTCHLTSLYLSNNPIGSAISLLAPGLKSTKTLQRLSLQSCGLKDPSTIPLLEAATAHPSLKLLDLGHSYATEDLGMRFNWLTETCIPALISLIQSTKLEYLNLSYLPIPPTLLNDLYTAALTSSSLLVFTAHPLVKGGKTYSEIKAGQLSARLLKQVRQHLHANVAAKYNGMDYNTFEASKKRFLVSPEDVRFIDSVYRNRDAGMARRGLMQLEKRWDDGDETLARVAEGVVD